MTIQETYIAVDGQYFMSLTECLQHEFDIATTCVGVEVYDFLRAQVGKYDTRSRRWTWPASRETGWFVYFIFHSDECIYVGRSHKLLARLIGHGFGPNHVNSTDKFKFLKCPDQTVAQRTERAMISWLQPKSNRPSKLHITRL